MCVLDVMMARHRKAISFHSARSCGLSFEIQRIADSGRFEAGGRRSWKTKEGKREQVIRRSGEQVEAGAGRRRDENRRQKHAIANKLWKKQ